MDYSKIEKLAAEKNIKLSALFDQIGMTSAGFYRMIKEKTMKVKTLELISSALGVEPSFFFDGKEPEKPAVSSESALISALQELAECRKEKETLLRENFDLKKPVGSNFTKSYNPELNEPK